MNDANGFRFLREQISNSCSDEYKIELLCEAVMDLLEIAALEPTQTDTEIFPGTREALANLNPITVEVQQLSEETLEELGVEEEKLPSLLRKQAE